MTIGITRPGRKAPRQNAVVGFIIAALVGWICLILLGLTSDFLVDWLWFSSIGYLQVIASGCWDRNEAIRPGVGCRERRRPDCPTGCRL
jgi:hypothetical protein